MTQSTCPRCDAPLAEFPLGIVCPACGAAYNGTERSIRVDYDGVTIIFIMEAQTTRKGAMRAIKKLRRAMRSNTNPTPDEYMRRLREWCKRNGY